MAIEKTMILAISFKMKHRSFYSFLIKHINDDKVRKL